jgi:hypothetical protein
MAFNKLLRIFALLNFVSFVQPFKKTTLCLWRHGIRQNDCEFNDTQRNEEKTILCINDCDVNIMTLEGDAVGKIKNKNTSF